MSDHSAIEWTGATWNPVTGCTKVSPGCAHCYIERQTPMRIAGRRFAGGTTGVLLHPERLDPAKVARLKPLDRPIFVCSMADLFHEQVPDDYIRDVFNVMRSCDGSIVAATGKSSPSRTFQVLTKRPERLLELARTRKLGFGIDEWRTKAANVWLGVSIENARYTWRADVLREIPAAVRFISAEPLLGSLFPQDPTQGRSDDPLRAMGVAGAPAHPARAATASTVAQRRGEGSPARAEDPAFKVGRRTRSSAPLDLSGIDWVIVGGESGPGARPMHPDWAREIRDACHAVPCSARDYCTGCDADGYCHHGNVPGRPLFFFKQWGEWVTEEQSPEDAIMPGSGKLPWGIDGEAIYRLGKKAAGRLLDGREWNEMPRP